ncbi:hypothetical protein OU798_09915 [Prolixibacteraceae bacterium Z1-6]|uniref:Uncharacterized protein n=1 Tax=Draconibacterium aestuarii TaxID=2998507 RepID=A0A9X3J4P7_9BACT|nr:hypothetical protein [Prolixibacteraceae bacterium Z1-6]
MKTIKLLLITALLLAGADTFGQKNSQRNQKNNSKNNVIHTVPRNNVKYKKTSNKSTKLSQFAGKYDWNKTQGQ